MLMRKRAWDMVREDFPRVQQEASLVEAIRMLYECVQSSNGYLSALVMHGEHLVGGISIWDVVRFMNSSFIKDGLDRTVTEGNYETLFGNSCALAGSTKVKEVMDRDVTVLAPDDPMPIVIEKLVKKGRSYAVVKEGNRVLGPIMIHDIFCELGLEMKAVSFDRGRRA